MTDEDKEKISLLEAQESQIPALPKEASTEDETRAFELEHEERVQKANIGFIGRLCGAGKEKPGNIAAAIAIVLLIYLFILTFCFPDNEHFLELAGTAFSAITLILGYLFGSTPKD